MKTSMDLERAIESCRDGVRAGFKVEVIPSPHAVGEYYVFADGIPITPVDTVTDEDYSVHWGRNSKDGCYWVKFQKDGHSVTYNDDDPLELEQIEAIEEAFCGHNEILNHEVGAALNWEPWPGCTHFYKVTTAHSKKYSPDLSDPEQCGLRPCHFGCGRMLRSHEKFCPNCVADGDSLYNKVGGR